MNTLDLNCDLGESFGNYTMGLDAQVIPLVSSVNIACGSHAGDPCVMKRTVELAKNANVAIGAHPGFPDLQGFGRRDLNLSPDEVYSFVLYQIAALQGFCKAAGVQLHHIKPHGQLYNRAAKDASYARAIAAAVRDLDESLVLVGLANGELIRAGQEAGLTVAQEFFADRNYTDEGRLVPRSEKDATITDEEFAVARVVRAVQTGKIAALSGKEISVCADTVCIHGDNTHALEFAKKIKAALNDAGIKVCPVGV